MATDELARLRTHLHSIDNEVNGNDCISWHTCLVYLSF